MFRFHCWLASLRVLEIEEIKSVPYAPVSHLFVQCLIDTIRRDYPDRIVRSPAPRQRRAPERPPPRLLR